MAGTLVNSDRALTGNGGSFAEFRVRISRIALKIPPSNDHLLKEHMNTLTSKLTAFAAALLMNGLVMSALGYLFVLQSHPNMSAIASSSSAGPFVLSMHSPGIGDLKA